MPRRLAIHVVLAIGVYISSLGCKSFKGTGEPSTNPEGEVVQNALFSQRNTKPRPATQKSVTASRGKVMLVDQALGFCVINFMFVAQMPPSEQRFFVYRGNQQVGEIVTTAQTDETFLVADINKGDIREGDSVRPD